MNFDNQELMGKWCIHRDEIAKIAEVKISKPIAGWTALAPIRLAYLMKTMNGNFRWVSMPKWIDLSDVTVITEEVADIFMQANKLKLPERKPNESKEGRPSNSRW